MGVYSEINLNTINEILSYYGVGKASTFEPTIMGISNSNFKVVLENNRKLLLKVSNDKTISQLENEQTILLVLKKYDYAFSLPPLETTCGKAIYRHEKFFGVLFPFIDGLPPFINSDSIYQIGMALGQLHSLEIHSEDLSLIRKHEVVGHDAFALMKYVQCQECPVDFKASFDRVFGKKLEDVPYDLLPAGLIHGDLYYDNSLFDQEKLITLIDFEQSGTGRFILDIGIAISGSCLNSDKTNIDELLMERFLDGYERARHIIHLEKEYLNLAIAVGFYSIALWRIERFYSGNLDSSKKYNYRDLISRCDKFVSHFGLGG